MPGGSTGARTRALAADEIAWIALLPCAVALVAAIVVLGPPLGHRFLAPHGDDAMWPADTMYMIGQPEPAKHARIALALLGPPLLALLVLAAARRRPHLTGAMARPLVLAGQLLALALVVAAALGQSNVVVPSAHWEWRVFAPWTYAAAVALPLAALAALRAAPIRERAARLVRETRARRMAALAVAALLTACWLLTAVNTEGSTGRSAFVDLPPWAMADTLAILDGRTPLVNYYPLYGGLWAYVGALPMALFGTTIGVFSVAMTSISGISLLAVYATFRRIVRSSLLALALYLPLLATGFLVLPWQWVQPNVASERPDNAQIFSVWPMRYAGPYLLAWLTARHLDGARPRRTWPLFLLGGLVALNNLELGGGALAGTLFAVLAARPLRSRQAVARLAGAIAGGLAGAVAIVAAIALVRSGSLPHPGFLVEYAQIFGRSGAVAKRLPSAGFHLVLYATYTAAIATATVRFVRRDPDRLLTGMLAWSGVFGLLGASYFAGRSDIFKLTALFSAWSFALALLTVVVVRSLAARAWRRPRLPELLVLAGFALAACSLVQVPAPWTQLQRLGRTTHPAFYDQSQATRLIGEQTRSGEHVAILIAMGKRIAHDLHLVDVMPYEGLEAMYTKRQWQRLLAALEREHARKLFTPDNLLSPSQRTLLSDEGFSVRATRGRYSAWVRAGG